MPKIGNAGSVELIDFMGNDLTVVNAARVSFHKVSQWDEVVKPYEGGLYEVDYVLKPKDKKLIEYLAKHKHWTPFAHCQITMHIKAPMPIRTQFFKHKVGFVENEVSRRYVDNPPEFFKPSWSARPDGSMKQGAGGLLDNDNYNKAQFAYSQAIDICEFAYKRLLSFGVAPEQARFVLPQATYTEWYWTGSLAAYARFYQQRTDPHAQAEIREYAEAIGTEIAPFFPVSWDVLVNTKQDA